MKNSLFYCILSVICIVLSIVDKSHSDGFFVASIVLSCTSAILSEIRNSHKWTNSEN